MEQDTERLGGGNTGGPSSPAAAKKNKESNKKSARNSYFLYRRKFTISFLWQEILTSCPTDPLSASQGLSRKDMDIVLAAKLNKDKARIRQGGDRVVGGWVIQNAMETCTSCGLFSQTRAGRGILQSSE